MVPGARVAAHIVDTLFERDLRAFVTRLEAWVEELEATRR